MERVKTGIPGLDELIEGGFLKGSVNLLTGGPGTGKSLLGLRYIYSGALLGEPGVYITLEEDPKEIIERSKRFNWDLEKPIKEKKMNLVRMELYDFSKLVTLIEESIYRIKATRIVIDPVTLLGLFFEKLIDVRKNLADLSKQLKKTGTTSILTSEVPEGTNLVSPFGVEEFITDSVILLQRIRQGNIYTRALSVLKMRGTNHSTKLHPIKIADDGVGVYSKEEVFTEF